MYAWVSLQVLAHLLDMVFYSDEKERVIPLLVNLMHYVVPYLRNHRYLVFKIQKLQTQDEELTVNWSQSCWSCFSVLDFVIQIYYRDQILVGLYSFPTVLTMPPVIVHVSSCWAVSVVISTPGELGRKKPSTCLWIIRFSRWTPLASASEYCTAQHVLSSCRCGFTATHRAMWPLVDHIFLFQLESNHRPPDDSWQNHFQRPDEWVFPFY